MYEIDNERESKEISSIVILPTAFFCTIKPLQVIRAQELFIERYPSFSIIQKLLVIFDK